MTLTLTHSPEDGTLIEGTTKGDGTSDVLRAHGWRWSRNLGAWYVPRSRDTRPNRALIDSTLTQLQDAGHDVEVQIDERIRAATDVETSQLDRMKARADALISKAEKAHARAAAAAQRSDRADQAVPPGGQPILVGHHSEAGHRRAIGRARNALSASVAADAAAAEADRRADTAAAAKAHRYNPVTVANRIARLSAELRRLQRDIARHQDDARPARMQLEEQAAVLEQEVEMWSQVRAEQIAAGETRDYGRHNVTAGDRVQIRGHWYRVVRANAKTVTVPSSLGDWTDTAPWAHVTEHRPAITEEKRA
ncbi:DUF3560 domain-containing protein [Cellulomonas sp. Y8]|uniref:DUF3560 domain-containing protein n=1 Tax=Cellulomonas sp. Y8 TaxID=2591145 RepID=UPI003D75CC4C